MNEPLPGEANAQPTQEELAEEAADFLAIHGSR